MLRCAAVLALFAFAVQVRADAPATIARVKASVFPIGTFVATRAPQFEFLGTAFAVGDGSLLATNAHVVARSLDAAHRESYAVLLPATTHGASGQVRTVHSVVVDEATDLAILKLDDGPRLVPLALFDSDLVRDGQDVLLTGYPLGPVLGAFPTTHRGMISAIAPVALPQARAADLNTRVVHALEAGPFTVFQLDATVYPGHSGSPVYDPVSGRVLGIVNMVFVKGTKEAVLKDPSGIAYAIPAKHLQLLLERIR